MKRSRTTTGNASLLVAPLVDSDEDDEIWNYKSSIGLKKTKPLAVTASPQVNNNKVGPKTSTSSSLKGKKKKAPKIKSLMKTKSGVEEHIKQIIQSHTQHSSNSSQTACIVISSDDEDDSFALSGCSLDKKKEIIFSQKHEKNEDAVNMLKTQSSQKNVNNVIEQNHDHDSEVSRIKTCKEEYKTPTLTKSNSSFDKNRENNSKVALTSSCATEDKLSQKAFKSNRSLQFGGGQTQCLQNRLEISESEKCVEDFDQNNDKIGLFLLDSNSENLYSDECKSDEDIFLEETESSESHKLTSPSVRVDNSKQQNEQKNELPVNVNIKKVKCLSTPKKSRTKKKVPSSQGSKCSQGSGCSSQRSIDQYLVPSPAKSQGSTPGKVVSPQQPWNSNLQMNEPSHGSQEKQNNWNPNHFVEIDFDTDNIFDDEGCGANEGSSQDNCWQSNANNVIDLITDVPNIESKDEEFSVKDDLVQGEDTCSCVSPITDITSKSSEGCVAKVETKCASVPLPLSISKPNAFTMLMKKETCKSGNVNGKMNVKTIDTYNGKNKSSTNKNKNSRHLNSGKEVSKDLLSDITNKEDDVGPLDVTHSTTEHVNVGDEDLSGEVDTSRNGSEGPGSRIASMAMNAFSMLMVGSRSLGTAFQKGNGNKRVKSTAQKDNISMETSSEEQQKYPARQCPFYKKIPGTRITVDAFRYGTIPGCTCYFLSHFHYDHYGGLTKKFSHTLYCSKITGNLVKKSLGVNSKCVVTLPMEQPTIVDEVEVTLLNANHCPGAVLFLFKSKSGQVFLHTGDFRADPAMESYPALIGVQVNQLYLDTTYCDPVYTFPPQQDVIDFAVSLATKKVAANPKTLIVCGSYTIGKERIYIAIAKALQSKICVRQDKKRILECLEDKEISNMITLSQKEAQVHVLPMAKLNYNNLSEHLESQKGLYTHLLAFEPTGWTHQSKHISLEQIKPKFDRNGIQVYGVPYSEHSSYSEMKRFTQFIKPNKILPTVNNGNESSRKKMEAFFKSWMDELKLSSATRGITHLQQSLSNWIA